MQLNMELHGHWFMFKRNTRFFVILENNRFLCNFTFQNVSEKKHEL